VRPRSIEFADSGAAAVESAAKGGKGGSHPAPRTRKGPAETILKIIQKIEIAKTIVIKATIPKAASGKSQENAWGPRRTLGEPHENTKECQESHTKSQEAH
jgi:hypothetical protein